MSTDELARIAVTAVLGVAVGVVAARWLRSQAYRYADEQDLPSRRTGWVVVACAVLPTLMVLAWPEDPVAVVYAVSTVALVVLAAIDIDVFRLPDVITKPMALALVVALLAVALLTGDTDPWVRALLAGAGLGFCYLVLVFIGGGAGMGLGDAKLALSLGMLLGYQSWSHVVLGSMASFLLAGIAAIYLVLFRGAGRKSHLAFGPYLVAGTILVLVLPAIGRT
jgi:leader peptidase (prepilin peptidase)/N-methyltransferase